MPSTLEWSEPHSRRLARKVLMNRAASIEVAGWSLRITALDEKGTMYRWEVEPLHDGSLYERGVASTPESACHEACASLERLCPRPPPTVTAVGDAASRRPARRTQPSPSSTATQPGGRVRG